jgi:hypothetical protein
MVTPRLAALVIPACLIAAACVQGSGARSAFPGAPRVDESIIKTFGSPSSGEAAGTDLDMWVTASQIDDWLGKPSNIVQQLQALFGPDTIIRVDGVEMTYVPPRRRIQSVHLMRDATGRIVVDVLTGDFP